MSTWITDPRSVWIAAGSALAGALLMGGLVTLVLAVLLDKTVRRIERLVHGYDKDIQDLRDHDQQTDERLEAIEENCLQCKQFAPAAKEEGGGPVLPLAQLPPSTARTPT